MKFLAIIGCIAISLPIVYLVLNPEIIFKPTPKWPPPYAIPQGLIQVQNNELRYSGVEIAESWLSSDYCRLILLYPFTTEVGIGVATNENGIFATYMMRKQEVKIGDRLYIKGIYLGQPHLPCEDDKALSYNTNQILSQIEQDVLKTLNNERMAMIDKGIDYGVVSLNDELCGRARIHSANMAQTDKLFLSPASINTPYYQTVWRIAW